MLRSLIHLLWWKLIAMCSLPNAIEPFYVMKITEKSIAEDDMVDIYGHIIPKDSSVLYLWAFGQTELYTYFTKCHSYRQKFRMVCSLIAL